MFKPRKLKEAISLARMQDDQLNGQQKFTQPSIYLTNETPSPSKFKTVDAYATTLWSTSTMKHLTWDEMQN